MQFVLDLDPNKIDYDEINRLLQEKVKEVNLEEIKPINDMADKILKEEIRSFVDHAYSNHLNLEYGSAYLTTEGKSYIKSVITECLREKSKEYFDKTLVDSGLLTDKTCIEIMRDVFPTICTSVLFDLISHHFSENIFSAIHSERNRVHCEIEQTVSTKLHKAISNY